MPYKFGRKPAVHDLRTFRSGMVMAAHLDDLGPPPAASNDYIAAVDAIVHGNWGVLSNDSIGDCVIADEGHYLMLRTANAGRIVIPSDQQIIQLYSDETGYDPADPSTDQGTDETSDCRWMCDHGILGHKADSTAMVDPTDLDHVKWCVQLFGACKLGVDWTQRQMDQFDAGQTITGDPQGNVLGGHDVPIFRYAGDNFWICTWGRIVPVSRDFVTAAEEAHGLVFGDWVRAQGTAPSGFNLAQLDADLKDIATA